MGCNGGKPAPPQYIINRPLPVSQHTLLGEGIKRGGVQAQKAAAAKRLLSLQPNFEGEWCYELVNGELAMGSWTSAVIRDEQLTWRDGYTGSTSQVRVGGGIFGVIQVTIRGQLCTGELKQSCSKIHWSNGDVWSRKGQQSVKPMETEQISESIVWSKVGASDTDAAKPIEAERMSEAIVWGKVGAIHTDAAVETKQVLLDTLNGPPGFDVHQARQASISDFETLTRAYSKAIARGSIVRRGGC